MTDLAEFLSGLLDGGFLLCMAFAVGGVAYLSSVLRISTDPSPMFASLARGTAGASAIGALAAAGGRLVEVFLLKPLAFAEDLGEMELHAFAQTQAFRVNLLSIVFLALLAGALLWLRTDMANRNVSVLAMLLAGAAVVAEAWLTHAASRIGGSQLTIAMTVTHMLGAMLWAGGIMHLLLSWRQRHGLLAAQMWPQLVARFSGLGVASVLLIAGSGLYLGWRYAGDWQGLVGTGYGNVLVAKAVLFVCIVVLAALNYRAARRWEESREVWPLMRETPPFIETEVIFAAAILFAAASLSSHPPAVDVIRDRVPPAETWLMFNPKLPHLSGPETILWERPELTNPLTGEPGYEVNLSWDRFHHNVSGLFVLFAATLWTIDRLTQATWARHWPLLFLAFGTYVFLIGDPTYFPFGEVGFWESVRSPGVLQHWFLSATMAAIGWFEWRTRQDGFARPRLRYLFPAACIACGILLLAHSHNFFRLKTQYLTLATHVAIGTTVIVVGCARWLELRSPPPGDRIAGFIGAGALLLVGLILLFYVDPEDTVTWERMKTLNITGKHPG